MSKFAGVLFGLCLGATTHAQSPGSASVMDQIQAVTYIDLEPGLAAKGLSLLTEEIKGELRSTGCLSAFLIMEDGRPNHFLIVERWHTRTERELVHQSSSYKSFRTRLQPMLASPLDERTGYQVTP